MSIELMTMVSVFLAAAAVAFAVIAILFYRKKDLKSARYVLTGKRQSREKKKTVAVKQMENIEETQPLETTQVMTDLVTVCMDEETTLLQEQEESWIVLQDITYISETADHFLMGSVK